MNNILTLLIRLAFLGSFIWVLIFVPIKIWKTAQWKKIPNSILKNLARTATIFSVLVAISLVYVFLLASIWTFEQANAVCFGFSCRI